MNQEDIVIKIIVGKGLPQVVVLYSHVPISGTLYCHKFPGDCPTNRMRSVILTQYVK